jgi:Ca-activated chloride channel family protein
LPGKDGRRLWGNVRTCYGDEVTDVAPIWAGLMPDFVSPWLLLLALGIPLQVWGWLRQRRGALRYPATEVLAALPGGRSRWVRWGGAGLRAAALAALIIGLAGPRWPDLRTRMTTEGISLVMLADVSGSMAEPDFDWKGERTTRLEAVKRAFRLFVAGGDGPGGEHLDGRTDDQIGLVTFATRPEKSCPLTLNHSALLRMLAEEQPRTLPTEATTNIGDAIVWGLDRLASAGGGRKVLILLSDGEHNVPPPAFKPRQAAQLAASLHVPIYAIDAGGEPTAPAADASEEESRAATERQEGERALRAVAQLTGGRYFKAHDGQSLVAVYQEIDRLERQPIESFQYRRYAMGYPWFGLAALVLWVLVHALELTVWQRVP